jgi:hypothetical protein
MTCSNSDEDDDKEEDVKTEIERVQEDNTVTLDQFYDSVKAQRPQFMPIIRLVEVDGVDGAIGVICPDPRSPTTDKVFGIRFNEAEDRTEEFSDISDAMNDEDLEEPNDGEESPATENEEISDNDPEHNSRRLPKARLEYYIPSPRKRIISLKEHHCGTIRKVEELLDPNEVLSLNEFMMEQSSEGDVLHMTDDEVEDLPKDKEVKKAVPGPGKAKKGANGNGGKKKPDGGSIKGKNGPPPKTEATLGVGLSTNSTGKKKHRKRAGKQKQNQQQNQ